MGSDQALLREVQRMRRSLERVLEITREFAEQARQHRHVIDELAEGGLDRTRRLDEHRVRIDTLLLHKGPTSAAERFATFPERWEAQGWGAGQLNVERVPSVVSFHPPFEEAPSVDAVPPQDTDADLVVSRYIAGLDAALAELERAPPLPFVEDHEQHEEVSDERARLAEVYTEASSRAVEKATERAEKAEARVAELEAKLHHLIDAVDKADLTPPYEYPGRSGKNIYNRYGVSSKAGQRWLTPRELADAALLWLQKVPDVE